MLNPFPELLAFQFVIISFLRVVLAFLFLRFGLETLTSRKESVRAFFEHVRFPSPKVFQKILGSIQILGGAFFFVGAFVQYAAIVLSAGLFAALVFKDRDNPFFEKSPEFYMLLFAVTFSFLVFGAGAFAYDLPL